MTARPLKGGLTVAQPLWWTPWLHLCSHLRQTAALHSGGPLGPLVSSRPRPCPRSPSGRQKGAPRSQVGHAGAWGWVREPPAQKRGARFLLVGDWVSSPVRALLQTVARRREWYPIPVFLPRESCGQRSLVGCCLWVAQSRT